MGRYNLNWYQPLQALLIFHVHGLIISESCWLVLHKMPMLLHRMCIYSTLLKERTSKLQISSKLFHQDNPAGTSIVALIVRSCLSASVHPASLKLPVL